MNWPVKFALTLGSVAVAGCYSAPPPPRHVVEREVVDPYGRVVERDRYVVDGPPPPDEVEVVPVRPYYGAVWVRGYWLRGRHRWHWVPGHWR